MEDSHGTPKLKPSFRSLKFRKKSLGSMRSPHAAYRSPMSDNSSPSSIDDSVQAFTPKRQCRSVDRSEKSSLHVQNSPECCNFMDRSKEVLRSSYRSPFASPAEQMPDKSACESEAQTSSFPEQTLEHVKNEAKELLCRHISLLNEIEDLRKKGCETNQLKWYIDKLHEYNDIKDVAQTVMGRIADLEQTTVKNIHVQFGLTEDD